MRYSTDTRTIQPGDTYVAVRGEVYDGHTFIPQAVENGAAGVVIDRDVAVPDGVAVTRVDDSVAHLLAEASARLARTGASVVAITGSVGKTTTRGAIVAVLREAFPVVHPTGNLNTPLGLSLTLLNADFDGTAKLVLEMGARLPGDIRELCDAFPPTVSVVTTVKGVHLETLGSLDGVEREKGTLVEALGTDGTAVLNADDPRVRRMADRTAGQVVLVGRAPDADLRPADVTAHLPILGDHAVLTALFATAVGQAFGMEADAITRGLERIAPEKGRLVRLRGRGESTLVDDTYNASPDAVLAALDVLTKLDATRRIALLGDMLELGPTEVDEHARVLRAAVQQADRVVAVGPLMAQAWDRLTEAEQDAVSVVASSDELAEALREGRIVNVGAGDAVLVKGSQGTRMERVSEALLHPDLDPADVLPRQSAGWKPA